MLPDPARNFSYRSFDQLGVEGLEIRRRFESDRFHSLSIDDQIEARWLLDRQFTVVGAA